MKQLMIASLMALSLSLAACGGSESGGGSIASAPPPPAAVPTIVGTSYVVQGSLAPAPAWTTGTYSGIATIHDNSNGDIRQAPAGSVSLAVDSAAKTYALTITAGAVSVAPETFSTTYLPSNSSPLNPFIGTTVKTVKQWSDGIARPAEDTTSDVTSGGYSHPDTVLAGRRILTSYFAVRGTPGSHVSLGYWSLSEAPLNPDGSRGVTDAATEGNFVFGDRTTPADIPVSGTARYTTETIGENYRNLPIVFDVDFAVRTIAATYSGNSVTGLFPDGVLCCSGGEEIIPDPNTRIANLGLATQASGSAAISSAGSFDIALAGTAVLHTVRVDNTVVADQSLPFSGSISGALFGPQASELGGIVVHPNYSFSSGGRMSIADQPLAEPFAAVRTRP